MVSNVVEIVVVVLFYFLKNEKNVVVVVFFPVLFRCRASLFDFLFFFCWSLDTIEALNSSG